jgi:hypothetical protein
MAALWGEVDCRLLHLPTAAFDRGCVKTISLFLSVGNHSIKSIFNQWSALFAYF